MDEAWLLRAALRDRQVKAHAERRAAGPIEHLDGQAGLARPRRRGLGQRGRRQGPRRLVDEIARARNSARGGARSRERALAVRGGDVDGWPQDERRRRRAAAAIVREVFVEAVSAEQRAFRDELARARVVRRCGWL